MRHGPTVDLFGNTKKPDVRRVMMAARIGTAGHTDAQAAQQRIAREFFLDGRHDFFGGGFWIGDGGKAGDRADAARDIQQLLRAISGQIGRT